MTQMNTRIDDALKRQGDAVFAKIGLSPSEVVRSVWEYAARHAEAPAAVMAALSANAREALPAEASFRAALAESSSNLVSKYRESIGAPTPDKLDTIDYRIAREEAWNEKLQERALV